MRVVIIGGGAAGISTATRFRRLDENAEILILEKTSEFAVSNCGLTYYLSGLVKSAENLTGTSVETMRQLYNIEVRLNHEVIAINRQEKTVSIEGHEDEPYDKLVIAIGAYQLRPDIDGVLADNIFTIKNLETIEKIKEYINGVGAKNIVIVGGGLIGVEAAEAFINLGLFPVIIEAADHLLPPLDKDMAVIVQNYLREKGIPLYLNDKVMAFGEKDAVLASGTKLAYDMAIISTGVKPDLKLSVLSELELGENGGLIVDEYMRTSDENIYAAGDDVEVTNLITDKKERVSHAGLAVKEARIIADHLAGLDTKFGKVVNTAIVKSFDLTIGAIGANEDTLRRSGISYKKLHFYAKSHSSYYPGAEQMLFKLLFNEEGRILGAQGIGKDGIDKRLDVILSYLQKNGTIYDLAKAELCYAPPFATGRDAINDVGGAAENILQGREMPIFFDEVDWENRNNDTMIIDVRPQPKFAESHIPNAINIPMEAIRSNLDAIPHDKKVILYCNHGRRSYLTSCILRNRGFDNIYNLSGGMDLYNEILENEQIRNRSYERIVNM